MVPAVALAFLPADAAGSIRFVGTSVGSDTGCSDPGFRTVQNAVDAAGPGDTVYLCGSASPFKEQVIWT